jgi:hypothetical protein
LVWAGRPRLTAVVIVGFLFSVIVGEILFHFVVHEDYRETYRYLVVQSYAGLIAAVTVVAFTAALRFRFLGFGTLVLAIGFWLAEFACCWWLLPRAAALGFALPGLLALTIAPLALAPLALAWNRHR